MTEQCAIIAGGDFNEADSYTRDPFAKNPGVNAAISDPPPDMHLKPPMRGEVDHRPTGNPQGRNQQYQNFLGSWKKPKNLQAEKSGNRGNSLSRGDFVKGYNPNAVNLSHGDYLKSKAPRY